jgi:hypothetical protein
MPEVEDDRRRAGGEEASTGACSIGKDGTKARQPRGAFLPADYGTTRMTAAGRAGGRSAGMTTLRLASDRTLPLEAVTWCYVSKSVLSSSVSATW